MILKIQNIMDIKMDLFQWSINFWIKKIQVEQLKIKLFLIKNYQNNYTKQLPENLKKENPVFYRQYLGLRFGRYVIYK